MKFEELKLNYGYPLQLQTTNAAGQPERYSCRLIGCLPGRSILMSVPKVGGKLIKFRTGQKIVVRLMVDNGIGVFVSLVDVQTVDPYPILHISYPENVSFKGIRSATRVGVDLPMELTNITAPTGVKTLGLISDISISGARIEVTDVVGAIGDTVELTAQVEIQNVKRELKVQGIIRSRVESTEHQDPGLPVSYGLQFTETNEDELLIMYAYVYSQMAV